jgi:hypothetical protein
LNIGNYLSNSPLDGQQRLASIYGVFSQLTEQEKDENNYNPDLNIFEIYYNFENNTFIPQDEVNEPKKCIHLRKLIGVTKLINALNEIDSKYHKSAQELASKFLNYEIPVVTIENRNREDVGIIFERINNTGTRLSTLDLMTAWTWTDNFHLLDASNLFMEELEEKGFGDIKPVILLQIVSGIIKGSTKTENILKLDGEEVRDNWDSVLEAIRKAIDFLATDIKCIHSDFLPFPQQLIGLSKFFHEINSPSSEQIKIIRQWFWKTSFSKRYSSGQTNSKMDTDIENIIKLKNGNNNAFDSYNHDITVPLLKGTQFSKANPVTRSILLMTAQFDPVDMIKNQKIDIGNALSKYNRKEFHHIFPEVFLKNRGLSMEKIYCVVNFCFLSSESNKKISKRSPSDYFMNLIPAADYNKILDSNLIPIAKSIYQKDDYEDFLERRSNLLIGKIDQLCH